MVQQKLIFTCLVFFISLKIPNPTRTIFYQHLQVIVILFAEVFTNICKEMSVSIGTLMPVSIYTCFLVFDNVSAICLNYSICVARKIAADGNNYSLDQRFRIIFLPVCGCLYLVVMTTFPVQIITYRIMKIFVLIEWIY